MTQIIGIIATKNRYKFLSHALDSAINQTRKLDELIVVSDSDDEVFNKEQNLCKGKCIFLKDKYTRNYAGNLNTAIDNIVLRHVIHNSEDPNEIYIAFLDDDDAWRENYIEKCSAKLISKPDFVVAGLSYHSEENKLQLSVPSSFNKSSFLSKNPHVQGSNTFIRLATLLKAGCFDEALNSTTDRDFFTRVLMLNPSYEIIDEVLVGIDAYNGRPRLTNNVQGKQASLSYFYSKYSGLMTEKEKTQFFKRANRYTFLDKTSVNSYLPKEAIHHIAKTDHVHFDGNLVFGFIVSDESLGTKLLKSIAKIRDIRKTIVILCNLEIPSLAFLNKAKESGAIVIPLKDAKNLGLELKELKFAFDSLKKSGQIKNIAVSRTILHKLLLQNSLEGDVIWILDDDMEFKYLTREQGDFAINDLDINGVLSKYKGKYDAVIGSYSGDAPLPTLSTLRTSLLDFVYQTKLNKSNIYRTDIYENRDYYYDLSDNHIGLETPLKSYAKSIDDVFSGKATSRKLYVKEVGDFSPYCRGGNTIVFNRKILDIPNISPRFGEKIARRSDYFWVEQAKKKGFKIIGSSFAILHSKNPIDFNIEKESDKLLEDLLGSSFTKAIESGFEKKREEFYESFKQKYENRLTRIIVSFYRIIGLLNIANVSSYKGLDENFIKRFINTAKYYLYEPMVRASFDVVRNTLSNNSAQDKEQEISSLFGSEYEFIGSGQEGVVFNKNDSEIYKVFYRKQGFDFLKEHSSHFENCSQLEPLFFNEIHGYSVISYHQKGKASKYEGGHTKEVASLLRFLKNEGIAIANIKKDNFILLDGVLKFIDYGKNFVSLNEDNFDRETKRAYEMIKYPNLSENDFMELIEKDYMGDDKEVLFGIENFKKLVLGREKEAIHDGVIINQINKYKPKTILDYGAGKCKIMNQMKDEAECYVFDVDLKTMNKRALPGVIVIENIDEFKKKVDLVVLNLVLCNVTDEWDNRILDNISRILKNDGHAIISVCNPFFDSINNTELRSEGYKGKYEENSFYTKAGLYGPKNDYHRPFSFYENLLSRHGFKISEIIETNGVNTNTMNPISEHLVFDVIHKDISILKDCTLMIKVCPMDYEIVIPSIKQIVSNLENGSKFFKRIVSVDLSTEERVRRYSDDNKNELLKRLTFLKTNGTIDEIITEENHDEYTKWFGCDSVFSHCENGQQLLATINGFKAVKTRYVFQTDIDILYKTTFGSFKKAYEEFVKSSAITGTIGICRNDTNPPLFGNRTEVRTCFLDLFALRKKLPLQNQKNDSGQFVLAWHKAIDTTLMNEESIRFADKNIFFVHLPYSMKKDNFISAYLLGNIPKGQEEHVDAIEDVKSWYPKSKRPMAVFSRGKNVGVEKIKRMINSLKIQDAQDFDLVYFDDCSEIKEQEYLAALFKYDSWCKNHMILIENIHSVDSLANFDIAMKNVITNPNSIVINVDGDDALIESDALSIIREAYNNGADMTCGGCFRADKPTRRYSISSFKKCWERNGDNIWLHPKTFRRYLADYIGDFLIDRNKYIDVHTDYAMLLPIVEAAKHPVEIKKKIYYFEPSIDNQRKKNKYDENLEKETMNMLLKKAERRFMKPIVSVIGDAVLAENDEEYELAKQIGKELVEAGYRVQTGGLGGVMEAALKGAKESSKYEFGDTIAVLPGNDDLDANEYADIKIATGLDNMRAKQVVDTHAVIAIGGGAGTLAEIATAWSMYKLILAWDKKGWSSKLADSRIDERCRYKEIPDDKVYSFSKAREAIDLIQEKESNYQKEYHGIKWRKKK